MRHEDHQRCRLVSVHRYTQCVHSVSSHLSLIASCCALAFISSDHLAAMLAGGALCPTSETCVCVSTTSIPEAFVTGSVSRDTVEGQGGQCCQQKRHRCRTLSVNTVLPVRLPCLLSDETVGHTYAENWLDQPASSKLSLLINVK